MFFLCNRPAPGLLTVSIRTNFRRDFLAPGLLTQDLLIQDLLTQDLLTQDLLTQDLLTQDLLTQDCLCQNRGQDFLRNDRLLLQRFH